MKPAYLIGLVALFGALVGYIFSRTTGWYGTVIGLVIGILVGTIIYSMRTRKKQ